MTLAFTPLTIPLALAATLNFILAGRAWLKRHSPGALAFALCLCGLAGWSTLDVLVVAGADLESKALAWRLSYFPIALAAIAWTVFIVQYAGWGDSLRGKAGWLLLIEPLVTVTMIWTNDLHGLMWQGFSVREAAGLQVLDVTFGPWYWANLMYQYLTYVVGSAALAIALARRRRLYRLQAASLVGGLLMPMAGSMIYNAGAFPALDLAPFAFTLSGLIWWWGLGRYRVLDVAPVATPVALESIFEAMVDPVVVLDAVGGIVKLNPAAGSLFGNLDTEADSDPHLATLMASLPPDVVLDPSQPARVEVALGDGAEQRQFDLRVSPMWHRSGSVAGRILALRDVTDRNQAEQALAHQARHDALTGLPNRFLLRERLEAAYHHAIRDGSLVALLCLDLDNFKTVNDSLGHMAGDDLLVAVARRLVGCLRPGDLAARLGGDEFAIILAGDTDVQNIRAVASRLTEVLHQPFVIGSGDIVLGVSIGIALVGPGVRGPDDLLRNADTAMYSAKALGKNRFAFFVEEMHRAAQARIVLEAELRRALQEQQFEMYLQPVVDLESGRITGCEALVRWNHPERGCVGPVEFIGLCEELGLIVPLGEWVLRQACMAQRAWRERYGAAAPHVSVNLSPRQLRQADLVERVAAVLRETGADPGAVILELTESALLEDSEAILSVLNDLHALGLQLAIDDFGTGYSALSYLQRFPIDRLKIDRAFVRDLGGGGEQSALVRAIVALAQALGLSLVAEGIEHTGQREHLHALGCELGQGYLFARPEPVRGFEHLLGQQQAGNVLWPALREATPDLAA